MKEDIYLESLKEHEKLKGKLSIRSKIALSSKHDLSIAYTPGVAEPCRAIAKNKNNVYKYTIKGNCVAVVTDGSAVLGLGNIGAEAALPVMEGKAILFKEFAGIDAFPICLATQNTEEIIDTVKRIAPVFGGINLEDISAPRCFEIEEKLQDLGIPVMHDDQHGTAVVVLAALVNALKVTGRKKEAIKVAISGAGAAGIAITKMLLHYGIRDIILVDSKGIIHKCRNDLNESKKQIAELTNQQDTNKLYQDPVCRPGIVGSLQDAVKDRDVFIGVSAPGLLTREMVKSMSNAPIIFAMANPEPEIMPELAKQAGAAVVGTGRSDFPNQINNVLAFPGLFRGALDAAAKQITLKMKIAAAEALAHYVEKPTAEMIVPSPLDRDVAIAVAHAVKKAA